MTLTFDNILLLCSLLLFIGLLGSKTNKYGIPILLLFLVIGMLAGSDGIGGIYFYEPETAKFIGVIALSFILFSGGLDTRWGDIKPVFWQGITLSTVGVILTAGIIWGVVFLFFKLFLHAGLFFWSI